MPTTVTLSPIGGLANRMRAILSARTLCRRSNAELHIVWAVNSELHCTPQLLFDTSIWDFEWHTASAIEHRFIWETPRKGNLYIPAAVQHLLFDTALHDDRFFIPSVPKPSQTLDIAAATKKLYIASGLEFTPYDKNEAKEIFRPAPNIEQSVSEKLNHMGSGRRIGVHIRRTDNKQSIANSPDQLFITLIDRELDICPDTSFYLATDSESVKRNLAARYGNALHFSPHQAVRNTSAGIIEATAEMFTLSRMDKIIGSYYSSFSEMASQIGRIPLAVAKLEHLS